MIFVYSRMRCSYWTVLQYGFAFLHWSFLSIQPPTRWARDKVRYGCHPGRDSGRMTPGGEVNTASCSQDELLTGRAAHRASCSQGELLTGRAAHRATCSQGELLTGRAAHMASCSQGELLTGRAAHRASCSQGELLRPK